MKDAQEALAWLEQRNAYIEIRKETGEQTGYIALDEEAIASGDFEGDTYQAVVLKGHRVVERKGEVSLLGAIEHLKAKLS